MSAIGIYPTIRQGTEESQFLIAPCTLPRSNSDRNRLTQKKALTLTHSVPDSCGDCKNILIEITLLLCGLARSIQVSSDVARRGPPSVTDAGPVIGNRGPQYVRLCSLMNGLRRKLLTARKPTIHN